MIRCTRDNLDLAYAGGVATLPAIMRRYPLGFAYAVNCNYFAGAKPLGWIAEHGSEWNWPTEEDMLWPIVDLGHIRFSAGPWLAIGGVMCNIDANIREGKYSGFTASRVTAQIAYVRAGEAHGVALLERGSLVDLTEFALSQGMRDVYKLDCGGSVGLLDGKQTLVAGSSYRKIPDALVIREEIAEVQAAHGKPYKQLSTNFNESEFACKHCGLVVVEPMLVNKLQQMRDMLKRAISITSGYRCEEHNSEVGGAADSFHKRGMAADVKVRGMKPAEVFAVAEALGFGGIHAYADFTHVDVGPSRRW